LYFTGVPAKVAFGSTNAFSLFSSVISDLGSNLGVGLFIFILSIVGMVYGWQKNGWKTATKQAVENQDLWEELLGVSTGKKIDWQLLKGHVGVVGNERCDEIATDFADGQSPKLYSGVLENYGIKNILDISSNSQVVAKSKESKACSRAKAFSYVSVIKGEVKVHQTWAECEKRVKGKSGTRFKKVFSKEEEKALVTEWQN